jgi:AcrR family transcriptional regulator
LFSQRGFKGTTTSQIAQHAEVNEALIYRHFPAKEDLYTAILKEKIDGPAAQALYLAAQDQALPVEEALAQVAEKFFNSCTRDPVFLRLYYFSALERHELASSFDLQFSRRLAGFIADLIRRGIAEGKFREVDVDIAAHCFIGMLRSYLLMKELFPDSGPKASPDKVRETLLEIYLAGVRK